MKVGHSVVKPTDPCCYTDLVSEFVPKGDLANLVREENAADAVSCLIEAVETGTQLSALDGPRATILVGQCAPLGFDFQRYVGAPGMDKLETYFKRFREFSNDLATNRMKELGKLFAGALADPAESTLAGAEPLVNQLPVGVKDSMDALLQALLANMRLAAHAATSEGADAKKPNLFVGTSLKTERQRLLGKTREEVGKVAKVLEGWDGSAYKFAGMDKLALEQWVTRAQEQCQVKVAAAATTSLTALNTPLSNLKQLNDKICDPVLERAKFLSHMAAAGNKLNKAKVELEKAKDRVVREHKTLCYGQSAEENKVVTDKLTEVDSTMDDTQYAISLYTFLTLLKSQALKQNDSFMHKNVLKVCSQITQAEMPPECWSEAVEMVPTLEKDIQGLSRKVDPPTRPKWAAGAVKGPASASGGAAKIVNLMDDADAAVNEEDEEEEKEGAGGVAAHEEGADGVAALEECADVVAAEEGEVAPAAKRGRGRAKAAVTPVAKGTKRTHAAAAGVEAKAKPAPKPRTKRAKG